MDEHRLALDRLHQRWLDRVHEKRAHRAVDLKVLRRDWSAALRIGDDDLGKTLPQVREVGTHGKNRHNFRRDGDVEAARAVEAVELSAAADLDVAKPLCAEVHRPAELNALWIDVEAL